MVNLSKIINCAPKEWHNLPKAYVKRVIEKQFPGWVEERGLQGRKEIQKPYFWYGEKRPWESGWRDLNMRRKYKPPPVEPIKKWSIYRGDRVEVLVGPDKGKQGVVNMIVCERNWVFVEGLNCKYVRMDELYAGAKPQIMKSEMPLLVTKEVALVDPGDSKPTSVEWRFNEKGESVRVSLSTGRIIPLPSIAQETRDYKSKSTYKEQPKDTMGKDHDEITFEPRLKSFEQDVAESLGINYVPFKSSPRYYY